MNRLRWMLMIQPQPKRPWKGRKRGEFSRWIDKHIDNDETAIPRHALKKVFDDFYRVDSSLTRTTRGTGIGLALVKKFVLAMNGSITATNNDGPGCTITISLPA
ncbi:MAG: sensor histidine kinase [Deltaproteobacteria bacterium]|nr:sensor histidine kinase [Deltaproteobacteria bacterium]